MLLPENTHSLLFRAPVLRSTCVEAKIGFAVHSQTEYRYKVRLMENIFMINYILNQKF